MRTRRQYRICRQAKLLYRCLGAGIFEAVSDSLDDESLWTVCHFALFRKSISMFHVRTILSELFGNQWEAYYNAFASECHSIAHVGRQWSIDVTDEEYDFNSSVWGLGYQLEYGPRNEVNGYAVKNALTALRQLAANCQTYDQSFVPGEPSQYGIENIAVAENGRLLWIQYHSWEAQHKSNRRLSCQLNIDGPSTRSHASSTLNLDGQMCPEKWPCPTPPCSTTPPKLPGDFGHEIWDMAAASGPLCYWSSFWKTRQQLYYEQCNAYNAQFAKCQRVDSGIYENSFTRSHPLDSAGYATPVKCLANEYYEGHTLPGRRPFAMDCINDTGIQLDCQAFVYLQNRFGCPVRFISDRGSHSLIDLVHMKRMRYKRHTRLMRPALSNDLAYLSAVVNTTAGEHKLRLVLWRVELPVPVVLWPKGIKGLCRLCMWNIDKNWLIVLCHNHGTRAYNLKCREPKAVDITAPTPTSETIYVWSKICGLQNDILFIDGERLSKIYLLRLVEIKPAHWMAVPLILSTRRENFSLQEARQAGLATTRYIQTVCRNLVVSTRGELFDLDGNENNILDRDPLQHTTNSMVVNVAPYAHDWNVVAIHEIACDRALTVVVARSSPTNLELWEVSQKGNRKLRCANGTFIPADKVQQIRFGPGGTLIYVMARSNETQAWIIRMIGNAAEDVKDYIIIDAPPPVRLPPLGPLRQLVLPVFLARDTLILQQHFLSSHSEYDTMHREPSASQLLEFTGDNYTTTAIGKFHYTTCQIPEAVAAHDYPYTYRRSYYRWIDFLCAQPRDLEYRRSIVHAGEGACLSPGKRFLVFAAKRVPELNTPAHVELADLLSSRQPGNHLRCSQESLDYCLRARGDYWRKREKLKRRYKY